ncbi:uncharacterized protein BX663DRAFT_553383 [Cokeromyces recurvatus]|uniref:uncharacterized protein n=1 Tax=Cokeromyces recurvatus TaxID=90255 RepID=UPI00221EE628|nr:uncharacterized protein BX663DRAFT_553383 [Cokeromyces recurvatus]KAI7901137.1 hypothetical protein BX663DRAFT_553383 [Cokeromyces recurvatus]
MGFCNRCGEITTGKCKKCGGRSVESTISSLISERNTVSVVDRWQSQYAGTILSPDEIIVKKSPTAKRIPVTQSTFYNSLNIKKNVCSCCSKSLDYKTTIMENNIHYCKECHIKLFTKGECPTCHKAVSELDKFIEYANKIWHTPCFICFNCQIPLDKDPLVDLRNRPCCETCFMAQAGKRHQDEKDQKIEDIQQSSSLKQQFDSYSSQSSLSTLSSSSSTLDFYNNNNQRKFSRPRILDQSLFALPSLTRSSSFPIEEQEEKKRSKPIHHQSQKLESIFIPPNPSSSLPLHTTIDQQNHNTPISQKSSSFLFQTSCHHCHRPLGDATEKKVKVPLGDGRQQQQQHYVWFHKSCFLCSKCRKPFQKEDGQQCKTDGTSFYHSRCNFINCEGCQRAIQEDSFKFNDKHYHFDCFKCYANGCKIRLGEPVFEIGGHPFCGSCHLLATKPKSISSLPKLGGSKRCPRCKGNISIMDDTPGPLATRWHKKCLSCAKCSKQLDSAAKMRQGNQEQQQESHSDEDQLSLRSLVSTKEAGVIIGKGGKNVAELRESTGVRAGVSKVVQGIHDRVLTVSGTLEGVAKAYSLIAHTILDNPTSISITNTMNDNHNQTTLRLLISHNLMGTVIGRQGAKIKHIQDITGVRMIASKTLLPQSTERVVEIRGTTEAIEKAILEIGSCLIEDKERSYGTILYNPIKVINEPWINNRRNNNNRNNNITNGFIRTGNGTDFNHKRHNNSTYYPMNNHHYHHQQQQQQQTTRRSPYTVTTNNNNNNNNTRIQHISIPSDMVGCIIGKGGSKISEIRQLSGSRISIAKVPHDNTGERMFTIQGTLESNEKALYLLYGQLENEKERRLRTVMLHEEEQQDVTNQ